MNIAILETEHFEGAYPVIRLFDLPGNRISIYTTAQTHKRFIDLFSDSSERYSWIILPDHGRFAFFSKLRHALSLDKPDLLYINTISNNHLLYALILKFLSLKKVLLTVHDINCLFESRMGKGFRQNIIHVGKRMLVSQIDAYNVVSDTMLPLLRGKASGKAHYNLPGSVFDGRQVKMHFTDRIRIVVPGSVDKRRRDYEQVIEFLEACDVRMLSVTVVVLGGAAGDYGADILRRLGNFKSGTAEVITFPESIVDQSVFDKEMNLSHFVFIPSVINTTICGDIPEKYGISKSSGNVFDVIKHAKPFIIPAELMVPSNLETSCFRYVSLDDLLVFAQSLLNQPDVYLPWEQRALENSGTYTIEKIRNANPDLFG